MNRGDMLVMMAIGIVIGFAVGWLVRHTRDARQLRARTRFARRAARLGYAKREPRP